MDADKVATWIGLITGVAGIVLAMVTIWFATNTDRRSQAVNDQVIRSLMKIETEVERTSSDTKELIRVAWEKMIGGGVRGNPVDPPDSSTLPVQQVAEGLVAELEEDDNTRDNNQETDGESSRVALALFEKLVDALDHSVNSPATAMHRASEPSTGSLIVASLSIPAIELAVELTRNGHLSSPQYRRARTNQALGPLIEELRDAGILVPLKGHGHEGEQLVYWFPPGTSDSITPALTLTSKRSPKARMIVTRNLQEIGYLREVESSFAPAPQKPIQNNARRILGHDARRRTREADNNVTEERTK